MTRSPGTRFRGRGAFAGLALAVCLEVPADDQLHTVLGALDPGQSYVLVETPGEPPTLLLLGKGDGELPAASDPAIDAALADLAHENPEIREEAVLALDDLGAGPGQLTSALSDPAPEVREAAAAVLENRLDK